MRPRLVPDQPRRLIAYVRQSVERDGSISPEVQERSCRDWAASRGDTIIDVIADVGVSGLKWDKRPGVQAAMKAVSEGRADGIVVWRWSRLSRNRLHQALAIDQIERAGGVIESATEPFDTATAGGRFGRDVMLAAAAFESQQKAEQWADAHQRRLARGLPASGGRRLGYLIEDGQYVPDPELGPIVAGLYERYLAGDSIDGLAKWLNTLGVVSPRSGKRWTPRGVIYYLDTGFPAGLLRVRGEFREGGHEALIERTVWERYVRERAARATTPTRLLHPTTRLAGILRCRACGWRMTLHYTTRQSVRYRCGNNDCAGPAAVRVHIAEQIAVEHLKLIASQVVVPETAGERVGRERLQRAVARADAALTRLTVDLARDEIPAQAFQTARDELLAEKQQAEAELAAMVEQDRLAVEAPKLAAGLLEVWAEGDPAVVNRVARKLLVGVVSRGPRVQFMPAWAMPTRGLADSAPS